MVENLGGFVSKVKTSYRKTIRSWALFTKSCESHTCFTLDGLRRIVRLLREAPDFSARYFNKKF